MAQAYVVLVPFSGPPLTSESAAAPIEDPFGTADPVPTAGALFEIDDWSMDVEQTLRIGSQGSGAGAGKVTFNPFSITRKIDKASPHLFRAACSGTPFEFVDLLLPRPGEPDGQVSVAWRFGLVAVRTLSWSVDEGGPKETVTFEYGSLTIGYAEQSADGTIVPVAFSGWDRVRNVAIH